MASYCFRHHTLGRTEPSIVGTPAIAALRLVILLFVCCATSGCGFATHLLYWVHGGHKIEAEFSGLEDRRVAVICVSSDSSYGPNSVSSQLSRSVSRLLEENIDGIEVVQQDEISDWIDTNDWNEMDYREIGHGVEAEMVLALDVDGLSLYEGRTLYKGRADVTVSVYELQEDDHVVFRRSIPEFMFPRNGARHSTEMSESRFRALFVQVLAKQVTKYFFRYNLEEEFAQDATSLGI